MGSDEDAPEGSSDSGGSSSLQVVPQRSVLDSAVLAEWEDRMERGLFRYDVTACPTKVGPEPGRLRMWLAVCVTRRDLDKWLFDEWIRSWGGVRDLGASHIHACW
jgi:hypothetical protein